MNTSQDLLYIVSSIALVWVAGFLCWALYELARLLRQSNDVMAETRAQLAAIREAASDLRERIDSSLGYVSALAAGGKAVLSVLRGRKEKRTGRRRED